MGVFWTYCAVCGMRFCQDVKKNDDDDQAFDRKPPHCKWMNDFVLMFPNKQYIKAMTTDEEHGAFDYGSARGADGKLYHITDSTTLQYGGSAYVNGYNGKVEQRKVYFMHEQCAKFLLQNTTNLSELTNIELSPAVLQLMEGQQYGWDLIKPETEFRFRWLNPNKSEEHAAYIRGNIILNGGQKMQKTRVVAQPKTAAAPRRATQARTAATPRAKQAKKATAISRVSKDCKVPHPGPGKRCKTGFKTNKDKTCCIKR